MGQQWQNPFSSPQNQWGPFSPGGLPGAAAMGFPYASSLAMDPTSMYPGAGGGSLRNKVLSSIMNPNNDAAEFVRKFEDVPMLPDPKNLLWGMPLGIAAGYGLDRLFANQGSNLVKAASWVDNLWGFRHVSDALDNGLNKLHQHGMKAGGYRAQFVANALGRMPYAEAERFVVKDILKSYGHRFELSDTKRFLKQMKSGSPQELVDLIKAEREALIASRKGVAQSTVLRNHLSTAKLDAIGIDPAMRKKLQEAGSIKKARKILYDKGPLRRFGSWVGRVFAGGAKPVANTTQREAVAKLIDAADREWFKPKYLKNLRTRLQGEVSWFLNPYKGQLELKNKLRATTSSTGRAVGPIGRGIGRVTQMFNEILTGDYMGIGRKAGNAAKNSIWPMIKRYGIFALFGGWIFGEAIGQAAKAEKGDKAANFFHNFLGIGVGSFIGWLTGRSLLRNVARALPRVPGGIEKIVKKPLPGFLKRAYSKVGRVLSKNWFGIPFLSAAGFLIETTAMFGFGSLFQKGFEWVSHKIFGKPKYLKVKEQMEEGIMPAQPPEPGQPPLRRIDRFDRLENYHPPQAAAPIDPLREDPNVIARNIVSGGPLAASNLSRLSPDQIAYSPADEATERFLAEINNLPPLEL